MDELASDTGSAVEMLRPYLCVLARMHLDRRRWARLDPEDLVQSTLQEAVEHWDQFRGNGRHELKGWLRGMLLQAAPKPPTQEKAPPSDAKVP